MKEIQLTKGKVAKVSNHRFEYLNQWKWYATYDKSTKSYYAARSEGKWYHQKTIRMHRFIMDTPANMKCDHVDHDTLNNQDENLRNCTSSQNNMNVGIRKDNTSGYKGVSKSGKKWKAQLQKDGRFVLNKNYATPELAALAYNEAAKEVYGEFATLNFVQPR